MSNHSIQFYKSLLRYLSDTSLSYIKKGSNKDFTIFSSYALLNNTTGITPTSSNQLLAEQELETL